MKCKYTFPVEGCFKFPFGIDFSVNNRHYSFEVKDDTVIHLSVTISNFPLEYLPTFTKNDSGNIEVSINIPSNPIWNDLVSDMRTMEGVLCLWGIKEISIDKCDIDWIPESKDEKEILKLLSFTWMGKNSFKRNQIQPDSLSFIVRSMISVSEFRNLEIPLNFYRRGTLDIYEERYIDSIYDFYFVLETLFANGKFKKTQVIQQFRSSNVLLNTIDEMKKEIDPQIVSDSVLYKEFNTKYQTKSGEAIIEHIVELRGFLHHHTLERKKIWHPAKQREYKVDALVLSNICFHILSEQVIDILLNENSINEFLKIEVKTHKGATIRWKEK